MPTSRRGVARNSKEVVTHPSPRLSKAVYDREYQVLQSPVMPIEHILMAIVALVVAASIGWWIIARKHSPLEKEIHALVKQTGSAHLRNLLIPDGMGGEIHIAHLLNTTKGFLLLDPREVEGMVFAGERMDQWSATHQGNRVAFDNPIPSLLDRLAAVRAVAYGVPVDGKVIFSTRVSFPKGCPDVVTTIPVLAKDYPAEPHPTNNGYASQWEELRQLVQGKYT